MPINGGGTSVMTGTAAVNFPLLGGGLRQSQNVVNVGKVAFSRTCTHKNCTYLWTNDRKYL